MAAICEGFLSGRQVGGVWARVWVVTWFRTGAHPWEDPRGPPASQLVGQVRDQPLTAEPLIFIILCIIFMIITATYH